MTAGVKGSKATTTYGGGSRYSPIRTAPNEIRDTGGASEVVVAVVSQEEYLILQPEEQQHEPSSNNGLISVNDSSFSPLGGHGNHHDVSSTDNNNNNEEEDEEVVYISVNDAIERLGFGRFQYQITIAAGLCFESATTRRHNPIIIPIGCHNNVVTHNVPTIHNNLTMQHCDCHCSHGDRPSQSSLNNSRSG